MKLRSQFIPVAAFTLIEVAISLGVIAVALIAIMGALPAGMQVQRDNRQDTVINADGTYLLEAIRTSAANIPDLTQYSEVVSNQAVTGTMTSADVVRLMCAPGPKRTNIFHAISGAAALRGVGVPSFRYMVLSEVHPVIDLAQNLNLTSPTNLPHANVIDRNTYEVRLVFLWPLKPYSTAVADVSQKQVLRTLISGRWDDVEGQFKVGEFFP